MQQLIDTLGAERAAGLFPLNDNPDRTQPLGHVAHTDTVPGLGVAAVAALADAGFARPTAPVAVGSNNWAIAPARAAGGAAVVVNDPHLDARVLPGIWMPIGLFSPEVAAVGAALPAVPGQVIGRNSHVAFGVTNTYGDSQDLFVEQVAPGRPDHYVDGDTLRPFETTTEVIRVKDPQAPGGFREERFTVRRTVRGPVVSDEPLGPQRDRLLSLRMASAEVDGREIGLDRLLVARDADEVDRAAQQMEVLYFNVVFADKAGAIGHRATGRVPIRRSGHGVHPKPVAADDDWIGVIPPDRRPGQLSPARGWVATANHDTRPDGYAYDYSSHFAPSYRYQRIAQVLDASRGMTTADQRRLLTDTTNLQVPKLLPAIVTALKATPEHADLLAILRAWDGQDRVDQAAPLVYHRLYEQIACETFVDELGEPLALAYLKNRYLWQRRFDRLVTTPDARWFNDRRTSAVETLPDLVRRAARTVRKELAARHGADPAAWRWGAEHSIRFDSPLRRSGAGREALGRAPTPIDGSGDTVMRAATAFKGSGEVELFASLRFVADLADDEKVLAVVSGGVVERQFHPHQKDQLDTWFAGELLPWWFDRRAIERESRHRQTLVPRGR